MWGGMKTKNNSKKVYVVRERVIGGEWRTESTYSTQTAAETACARLARREPKNNDGESMEYTVIAVPS